LGTEISGPYRLREIVGALVSGRVVGVAHGRAEFGPRALGNRSLLADPRGPDVKDRVNRVKGREPFRPFAPSILAELADRHFQMVRPESPYMQFVVRCRRPEQFPAIVHRDGTSRVHTVRREQNPHFYELLREFHRRTGCPMLLDTSLNVRGEPLVNSREDARRFAAATGVPVF
jgi:carbamoyltransferase